MSCLFSSNSRLVIVVAPECSVLSVPISIVTAILGGEIEVPTIDGKKARLKIPSGTQSETQFRLRGKGMPYIRGSGNGDLYVQVKTEVPISLNKEQKE